MLIPVVLAALTAQAIPPQTSQRQRLGCRNLYPRQFRRNPKSRGHLPECFAAAAASLRRR